MKKYYVVYYNEDKLIAGTLISAESEDDACINAEFKMMCLLPNVMFDRTEVTYSYEED